MNESVRISHAWACQAIAPTSRPTATPPTHGRSSSSGPGRLATFHTIASVPVAASQATARPARAMRAGSPSQTSGASTSHSSPGRPGRLKSPDAK